MRKQLYTLTAIDAAAGISDGSITCEALVRSCLERIEEREADVGAWAYVDRDGAIAAAQALDRGTGTGLLRGMPVGIKDIVETADMPTGFGSPIYHSHQPVADAVCVTQSRASGAIILGKTISTEFAFRKAGKTSHPQNRCYSPGGSSSGSAAAVADGMVPLAIGTQTGGSVIRPASYCGVYGFKPTYNVFSLSGVRHLAETFDTLGCMARTLGDIGLYRAALLGTTYRPIVSDLPAPRIGFCRTEFWAEAQPAMRKLLEDSVDRLSRCGAKMIDFVVEGDSKTLLEDIWTINKFEAARLFAYDHAYHPESVSSDVRQIVADGRKIPLEAYFAARRRIDLMRARLDRQLEDIDALVTPSSPGEPPLGLADTGPITFNVLWTAAYTPALTMPAGKGPNGLPLGLQLVARQYEDEHLLAIGSWVERALAFPS